jgi:hypothetical protein
MSFRATSCPGACCYPARLPGRPDSVNLIDPGITCRTNVRMWGRRMARRHDRPALDPHQAGDDRDVDHAGGAGGVGRHRGRLRPARLPARAAERPLDPGRAGRAHDLGRAGVRRPAPGARKPGACCARGPRCARPPSTTRTARCSPPTWRPGENSAFPAHPEKDGKRTRSYIRTATSSSCSSPSSRTARCSARSTCAPPTC